MAIIHTEIQIALFFQQQFHQDWIALYNDIVQKFDIFDGLSFPTKIDNPILESAPRISLSSEDNAILCTISPKVTRLFFNPIIRSKNHTKEFKNLYTKFTNFLMNISGTSFDRLGGINTYFIETKNPSDFICENFLSKNRKKRYSLQVKMAFSDTLNEIEINHSFTISEGHLTGSEKNAKKAGVIIMYDVNNKPDPKFFFSKDDVIMFINKALKTSSKENIDMFLGIKNGGI